jgi:hypothetical protein
MLKDSRTHQVVARAALSRAAIAIVRYYAALRLSAGAATALLPLDMQPARPPIIRASRNRVQGGFDRREIVYRSGKPFIVTVDAERADHVPARSKYSLN